MTQQSSNKLDPVIHTAGSLERGRSFEDTGNISMSQLNGFFNRILFKYQPTMKGKILLAANGVDVNKTERLLAKLKEKKNDEDLLEKEEKPKEVKHGDAELQTKSIYSLIDNANNTSITSLWESIKNSTLQNQMSLFIPMGQKEHYLSKINYTKSIYDEKELEHFKHSYVLQEALNTLIYARDVCQTGNKNFQKLIDTCNSLMKWNDDLWKKLREYEKKFIPISRNTKYDGQDSIGSYNSPSPINSQSPTSQPPSPKSDEDKKKEIEEEELRKKQEEEAKEKEIEELFTGLKEDEIDDKKKHVWFWSLNFEYFFLLSTLSEEGIEKTDQFRSAFIFLQRQYRYHLFGSYTPSSKTIENTLKDLPPMKKMWKLFRSGLFTEDPFLPKDTKKTNDVARVAECLSEWIGKVYSRESSSSIESTSLSEIRSIDEITSAFIEIIGNSEVTQPAPLLESVEDTVFLALLRFVVKQQDAVNKHEVDQSSQIADMQKAIRDELFKVKHENESFKIVEPMILIELGLYSEAVDALVESGYFPSATVHIVYVVLQLVGAEVDVEQRMKKRFQRIVWDFIHLLPKTMNELIVDDRGNPVLDSNGEKQYKEIDVVQIASNYLLLFPDANQIVDFVIENGREGHKVEFLMKDFSEKGRGERTDPERKAFDMVCDWIAKNNQVHPRKTIELLSMLNSIELPIVCKQVSMLKHLTPSDVVICVKSIAGAIENYSGKEQELMASSTLRTAAWGLMAADRLEPDDRSALISSVQAIAAYLPESPEARSVLRLARLARILDAWDEGNGAELEAIADEVLPTGDGRPAFRFVREMHVRGTDGTMLGFGGMMPVECGLRAILYFAEHCADPEENKERISEIDRFCQYWRPFPEYDERLLEIRTRLKI